MGRVHLLPGSTDSSPSKRAGYHSENEAKLTLGEFTEWLTIEIAGAYHHGVHRILGTIPAAAWAESIAAGVIPALPADPEWFVIEFLPVIHRKLQSQGTNEICTVNPWFRPALSVQRPVATPKLFMRSRDVRVAPGKS
jgi:putative transposase